MEFARKISKPVEWVRVACEEGRILACQKVGIQWVIAEDTLIAPRFFKDIDPIMLDHLPEDMVLGDYRVEVDVREYAENPRNKEGKRKRVSVPAGGLRTVMDEQGLSQYDVNRLTGVTRVTIRKALGGERVQADVVLRLAYGLGVDISDILREDVP
jgi:hypothetical protein